jgi:hypothetical protein
MKYKKQCAVCGIEFKTCRVDAKCCGTECAGVNLSRRANNPISSDLDNDEVMFRNRLILRPTITRLG